MLSLIPHWTGIFQSGGCMYTVPHYLPHEEKTGLFGLPRRRLGIAALGTIAMIGWGSGGAPSYPTIFFILAVVLTAAAELLPARLWQARGWLRVASIVGLAAAVILIWQSPSSPPPKKLSLRPCGCSLN
jgi:hypothetical protein